MATPASAQARARPTASLAGLTRAQVSGLNSPARYVGDDSCANTSGRSRNRPSPASAASRSQSTWCGSTATESMPVRSHSASIPSGGSPRPCRRGSPARAPRVRPVRRASAPGRSPCRGSGWRRRIPRCARTLPSRSARTRGARYWPPDPVALHAVPSTNRYIHRRPPAGHTAAEQPAPGTAGGPRRVRRATWTRRRSRPARDRSAAGRRDGRRRSSQSRQRTGTAVTRQDFGPAHGAVPAASATRGCGGAPGSHPGGPNT